MKKPSKSTLKLVSVVSLLIFSLLAVSIGVYAWFSSSLVNALGSDDFEVITVGDCDLVSAKLIKFIYPDSQIGEGYDYLRPADGHVDKYNYNEEQEHFGYYDEDDVWVNVDSMNIYDPIELIITQDAKLRDLHCNAIYEITIHSGTLTDCVIDIESILKDDVVLGTNQMLLSDCADFDVFYVSDLSDTNPLFYNEETGQYDKYYPTYKDTLNDLEKEYHKISYLSSLIAENNHKNHYSSNPKNHAVQLKNGEIAMDSVGQFKFYINANYAPSQLDHLARDLILNSIKAVYDFSFQVALSSGGNE